MTSQEADLSEPRPRSLQNIFLHVTQGCNLCCRYCYFSASKRQPDEMTLGEYRELWPAIVKLAPSKLIFTGGEPLLRDDLFELLSDFKGINSERRVISCMNSNGVLVSKSVAARLVGIVDEVRISIDGMRESNDELRGEGSFDAAVYALKALLECGFEPKALITVTSRTLTDLPALIAMLVRIGVSRINVNPFREIGRGKGHIEWNVPRDELRTLIDSALNQLNQLGLFTPIEDSPEFQTHCGVGHYVNVMPNGDVFPCHVLTQPEFRLGNIRERDLGDICSSRTLLGELTRVRFDTVASEEPKARELLQHSTCMGSVYAANKLSPVWKKNLPSLGSSKPAKTGLVRRQCPLH
jgi:MoaA/NifB/PqqE/SkfB family radical SAM enzyme